MRPRQALTLSLGGAVSKRDPRPLLAASLRLDAETRVDVTRDGNGAYNVRRAHIELARREVLARGIITQSLAATAGEAGVSSMLIAKFADIYAFDVDFQRDIKANDTFEIYYTQYVAPDGEVDATKGEILFSRLSYNGKVKGFYRHAAADGTSDYYDETGKSARTFLMRRPVEGARISSSFGLRKHPILGFTRMHKGVDFAAPTGTKIFAAGAGIVELAARNGSFGNYVRIRHDNGYKTAYAHLSRYGSGVRAGARVTQGQVIGFVGMTGTANGPHLHYEVLQANSQINPMSVKVPTGRKLAGAELDQFRHEVARITLALKANPAGQFAANGGMAWGAR
ncbi:MAG: M23 family metallopeptidase [Alphaproteobacteria bacterium]